MRYILAIVLVFVVSGCVKDVSPWEKDTHAKAVMKDGDMNRLSQGFEEHIHFAKEGTKGGGSISGGGCGCN